MKSLFLCSLCLIVACPAFGQEMVKVNIVALYDKVPAPPASAREAFQRMKCTGEEALQKTWPEYRDQKKARHLPLQQKLAAINYGEAAENVETKRILVGAQSMLLGPADDLISFSREATETAARWWMQKAKLDRQKPSE